MFASDLNIFFDVYYTHGQSCLLSSMVTCSYCWYFVDLFHSVTILADVHVLLVLGDEWSMMNSLCGTGRHFLCGPCLFVNASTTMQRPARVYLNYLYICE